MAIASLHVFDVPRSIPSYMVDLLDCTDLNAGYDMIEIRSATPSKLLYLSATGHVAKKNLIRKGV